MASYRVRKGDSYIRFFSAGLVSASVYPPVIVHPPPRPVSIAAELSL